MRYEGSRLRYPEFGRLHYRQRPAIHAQLGLQVLEGRPKRRGRRNQPASEGIHVPLTRMVLRSPELCYARVRGRPIPAPRIRQLDLP